MRVISGGAEVKERERPEQPGEVRGRRKGRRDEQPLACARGSVRRSVKERSVVKTRVVWLGARRTGWRREKHQAARLGYLFSYLGRSNSTLTACLMRILRRSR